MLNIAITAGGTSENIDGVRKLTNVSTGSLGWNCLEAVLNYFQKKNYSDFRIFYILTETAFRKELNEKQKSLVEFISVSDAESVYKAVDELTKNVHISHFIHSMAISDFTFAYAANTCELAMEISSMQTRGEANEIAVREALENPINQFNTDEKIPSDDNIIIGLKRTKKVIPIIKQNNPETFLVGFKLLRDVSENELIDVANRLAEKNKCDMVFANQLAQIAEHNHSGMLIKNGEVIARPIGKKQIAETVVKNMLDM
ncbi:MAG: phosphopantothenoylcysteine decarboxylase [Bacteroidia bacterium]|nr:phosphopantothenoylcysteine decarboxylase [Bacteroidia bacterium]